MIVVFHHPHNEGVVAGIITGPGFDTGALLVDTYEVDAEIKSFATSEEVETWLTETGLNLDEFEEVNGGRVLQTESD